jgi:AraC-like DNA-binding protein
VAARPSALAWSPSVEGIAEVLHARFVDHVYPMHAHSTWTLLVVDDGAVKYDLDRHQRGAIRTVVTLLPPHVPHNGSAVTAQGFRKRVLYLDSSQLSEHLIGRAVDCPTLDDATLRHRIDALHALLVSPDDALEAESRLAFIAERLRGHLERHVSPQSSITGDRRIAGRLRDLLDDRFIEGITLREAARVLHANPTYLVRAFSHDFGIAPHQYVISRRVDLARRLLLDGVPSGEVAVAVGFYDQSHLIRHFKRVLGFSPGQYAPATHP